MPLSNGQARGELGHTLPTAHDDADDAKAATRLMVTLAYRDGVRVETIADRYGIPQLTIYDWRDPLENQPLADALRDEPRQGRPPKLSEVQRTKVEMWLHGTPRDLGYDAEEWTAGLLRDQIIDTFDVDYSEAHIHRLFFT